MYSASTWKLVKYIDTQLSKPIWDQQSPPLTWVSKTLNLALYISSYEYNIYLVRHMYKTSKFCSKFCIGQCTSKSCNSPWDDVSLLYPKIWYTLCWIFLMLIHHCLLLCLSYPILSTLFSPVLHLNAYSCLPLSSCLPLFGYHRICTIFPFSYSPKRM